MLKKILLIPIIAVFVLAFYYSELIFAADTGDVTATVTVQNIALTVSDGGVIYGIMGLDSTKTTVDLTDSQTIENTGNVIINVNIRGYDSTAWTLGATAGANVYEHRFCLATCTTYPTNYTTITTSYTSVTTGLAISGTQNLDLGLNTPTSSSSYDQQSVNVTVQAVAG